MIENKVVLGICAFFGVAGISVLISTYKNARLTMCILIPTVYYNFTWTPESCE